ncbi:transcriptional regulator with XRE-family HTH domain [Altererythrobacter atlanticus]|uniref:Transcriptional repressor DicA n=1 Tax=Croceibacterium atlanticum TaxID=1267766 RepID=A0A0F7KVQ3_9SPHN|nr:helix-turn-helix domain-containing protein [Croceibacterium atlanticum]AKH42860.1 transcriptional repressor DicA [Croceibacterium atlanticum]MBB5731640.1 transcriptional regulator with XRE-family HTH domain [Croceibacterium atlanticum]
MTKGLIGALEQAGDRAAPRRRLQLEVSGSSNGGGIDRAVIHNISMTGLLLETGVSLKNGDEIQVDLPEGGSTTAIIVWASGNFYGCKFQEAISPAVLSAVQLRSTAGQGTEESAPSDPAPGPVEAFHDRLTRLRKERKLSRAELAKRSEVSEPSIWAWEIGKRQPRRRNIRSLAAALDISERELLLGGDAGPAPKPDSAEGRAIELGGEPVPATSLSELIASSKKKIAALAGTTSDKVRIVIEM